MPMPMPREMMNEKKAIEARSSMWSGEKRVTCCAGNSTQKRKERERPSVEFIRCVQEEKGNISTLIWGFSSVSRNA